MSEQHIIQIMSNDILLNIETDCEITSQSLSRIGKQLHAIINTNLCHDLNGRITSIYMSLHMLERDMPPDNQDKLKLLKSQIEDLTHMMDVLLEMD